MDENRAREIASEWHGGQWSPLYMFASSGATSDSRYNVEDIIGEANTSLFDAKAIGQDATECDDLASLIAYLRNLPAILCKVCAEPITRVIEEHAIYWEASDGDSLSYVPTLHDHLPESEHN